jgi:hypothetical protein
MPKWVQMTALFFGGVIALSLLFFVVAIIASMNSMT